MATSVFVECTLARSAFSGERVFEISSSSHDQYIGVAPLTSCYDETKHQLSAAQPSESSTIGGFVSARMVRNGGGEAVVLVPDGEMIKVPEGSVAE